MIYPLWTQGFWQPSRYPYLKFRSFSFRKLFRKLNTKKTFAWITRLLPKNHDGNRNCLGSLQLMGKKQSTEACFCWERVTTSLPGFFLCVRTYSADQVKLNCYQPLGGWTITHVTNYAQLQVNLDWVSDVGIRGRHNVWNDHLAY